MLLIVVDLFHIFMSLLKLSLHHLKKMNIVSCHSRFRKFTASLRRRKNSDLENQLELLLFKRSKIIKKAENKIPTAVEIVKENFREGDYWLVYCQDKQHLQMARELFNKEGIKTLEYMSSMSGDRKATLDYYKTNGGVLIAIKCLDEGIDIPYLENAIILSSSQNPREHIQKRKSFKKI